MKTPTGLTAALIVASAAFAAPAAFAEQPQKEINARFAFDPADPAIKIYNDLNRTARRACEHTGTRLLTMVKHEQACVAEMVQDGVAKLRRADVAAVHNNNFASASAGTRG